MCSILGFGMCFKIIFFVIVCQSSSVFIDPINALGWPECGEFVFPNDDTNLSAEEKQFRRKLPNLFDSFESGNFSGIENTLKSLEAFRTPLTSDKANLERQTLSPVLEIVSSGQTSLSVALLPDQFNYLIYFM